MKHIKAFQMFESTGTSGKVYYHGTPYAFDSFSDAFHGTNTNHNPDEVGFHFTDKIETAETYSRAHEVKTAELFKKLTGRYPAHFKPFVPRIVEVRLHMQNPLAVTYSKDINRESIAYAKSNGYDSIYSEKSHEYVVFHPEQIEVLGSKPVDVNMDDMYDKLSDEVKQKASE